MANILTLGKLHKEIWISGFLGHGTLPRREGGPEATSRARCQVLPVPECAVLAAASLPPARLASHLEE